MKSKNITWHSGHVQKKNRQTLTKNKSAVLWFTGLSGSGKSTLAVEVEKKLFDAGVLSYRLDGDNIRYGLNKDLSFRPEDRKENIRRIGEVSKLFVDAGILTLVSFISPYQTDRNMVRALLEKDEFIEIYVKCDLSECEKRDPKGLYKKARNGEIGQFTGIHSPYEEPDQPEIIVETDKQSVNESTQQIMKFLKKNNYI
ncbi:adenylyl-sulfate kinase [Alteribacillus bidgolensis]|uniref:Adenylyl-sulfate kinase n=1 Tax=Alteribacillus bidgolensis TaxID=930129 RepID=A0A1G8I3H4_9BACI|nr:adenylyl-sulfate kinase [Alteribacillus bidgolensis]SDI13382.1 adenylylsulfate kinase [Alteribacillus bidgolensis]